MIVYKLKSGDRWYGTYSEFNSTEEDSPIFLNPKRIDKLIRDEIKHLTEKVQEWAVEGTDKWWWHRLEDWKRVEIVKYKLVRVEEENVA